MPRRGQCTLALDRRYHVPWHAEHMAERYSRQASITLGEGDRARLTCDTDR